MLLAGVKSGAVDGRLNEFVADADVDWRLAAPLLSSENPAGGGAIPSGDCCPHGGGTYGRRRGGWPLNAAPSMGVCAAGVK